MRRRRFFKRVLNLLIEPEFIGQKECPLMVRWTLFDIGILKAMIHYFPPEATDPDPHDHPRSFVTLLLRGAYMDKSWEQVSWKDRQEAGYHIPVNGVLTHDFLTTGSFRYRPAEHTHITETGSQGAWSIVVMGRLVRPWGFMRQGRWWPWKKYVEKFDGPIRCDPEEMHHDGVSYRQYKTTAPAPPGLPPWDLLG